MSRSTPRSAACARGVPAPQILPRPRQTRALFDENGLNALEATQRLRSLRNPVEYFALYLPHQPVEAVAERPDQHDRKEHQRRVEGVAAEHDDLPEPVTDAGGLCDQHHHPRAE